MDRVELGIKLEQISRLRDKGDLEEAVKVADTIEWRKVKKWSELSVAEEIYEQTGRLKEARNICVYAYNRNLGGKRLLYKLTELSIAINDLDEAEELYKEFSEEAPKDTSRYILLYKINVARGASIERLIEILEEYKNNELEEHYAYELAELYAQAGRIEECVRECDDLILWFNEGEYVDKALSLKKRFVPLTKSQQMKYDVMEQYRQAGINIHELRAQQEAEREAKEKQEAEKEQEIQTEYVSMDTDANTEPEEEILVPEKNYSIYDTQNIQAELAKSMSIIMESMAEKGEKIYDENTGGEAGGTTDIILEPLEGWKKVLAGDYEPGPDEDAVDAEIRAKFRPEYEKQTEEKAEPTKEIRLNTHHWNRSVSVATAPIPKQEAPAVKPQPAAEPVQAVEPEIKAEPEIKVEPETKAEPVPVAEPVVEERKLSPIVSVTGPQTAAKAIANIAEPQAEPEQTEEISADEIIEGQIGIMDWLSAMPEASEEPEAIAESVPKAEPVVKEDTFVKQVREEFEDDKDLAEEILKEVQMEIAATMEEEEAELVLEENTEDDSEEPQLVIEETDDSSEEIEEAELIADDEMLPEEEEAVPEMTEDEKKYIRKYLCMSGMEESINRVIQGKKIDIDDGTSAYGNIAIVGRADTDKTGFAINLFKALHAKDDIRQLKIAKTTAAILNKKGIRESADKIKGTTLIIENAGMLTLDAVKAITEFMMGQTESMLVMLTGEDYSIKRLFMEAPAFAAMFNYTIELKKLSVNDLVIIAKDYAREKGYSIDEKALLKVYLLIDELQVSTPGVEADEVKRLIDGAIAKCGKKGKGLFGRKSNGLISLKEKHFV